MQIYDSSHSIHINIMSNGLSSSFKIRVTNALCPEEWCCPEEGLDTVKACSFTPIAHQSLVILVLTRDVRVGIENVGMSPIAFIKNLLHSPYITPEEVC